MKIHTLFMFKLFRIGTIQNVRNRIWGILLLFRWILLFLWYLHSLVIDVSAWLNFSLWPLTSNAWIITVISWCHAWWELKYLNKLTILHCKSDPPSHQPPKSPTPQAHIACPYCFRRTICRTLSYCLLRARGR